MAGKLTAAQGTGILLVTANVGSLFEDVSSPLSLINIVCQRRPCAFVFTHYDHVFVSQLLLGAVLGNVSAGHDSCVRFYAPVP